MEYNSGMIVMKNGHTKYGLISRSSEDQTFWEFIDNLNLTEFIKTQSNLLVERISLEEISYIDPCLT